MLTPQLARIADEQQESRARNFYDFKRNEKPQP
jgi:hypothetical protein